MSALLPHSRKWAPHSCTQATAGVRHEAHQVIWPSQRQVSSLAAQHQCAAGPQRLRHAMRH